MEHLWSTAASLNASLATCVDFLQPEMMVCGWIFLAIRSSASCKRDDRKRVSRGPYKGPPRDKNFPASYPQKLGRQNGDGRGSVADFVVLNL